VLFHQSSFRKRNADFIVGAKKCQGSCFLSCVAAIDSTGRTIWIVNAHRCDGKRFVVRADEKLTAFIELESAIRGM